MRKLFAVMVVVGIALVAGACEPHNPAQGPVCVWGDSITDQSFGAFAHATYFRDAGYTLQVGGIAPGYGLRDYDSFFKQRIEETRANAKDGNCKGHVVALGTNDEGTEQTQEEHYTLIAQFLDNLGDVPIIYVAPNRYSAKGTQAGRDAFEAALEQYAGEHSNVHVYKLYEDLTPSDYDGPGEVHLTQAGIAKWADYVEDRMDEIWPSDSNLNTEVD